MAREEITTWRELKARHMDALSRKHAKIGMLQGLVEAWSVREDRDENYLRGLRRRLHCAQTQLKAMKP